VAGEDGQDLADPVLAEQGVVDRDVGPDLVLIARAVPLLCEVALLDQLADDAVGAAFG
jgi:hypothetical protein